MLVAQAAACSGSSAIKAGSRPADHQRVTGRLTAARPATRVAGRVGRCVDTQDDRDASHTVQGSRGLIVGFAVIALVAVAAVSALVTLLISGEIGRHSPPLPRAQSAGTHFPTSGSGPTTGPSAPVSPTGRSGSVLASSSPTARPPTTVRSAPHAPPANTRIVVISGSDLERWPATRVIGLAPDSGCQQSNVLPHAETFRCYGDDGIYDPCFAITGGAACPDAPWSRQYIKIAFEGDSGIPRSTDTSSAPWGVELSDGQRCAFIDGAGGEFRGGLHANYGCPHGNVFGDPSHTLVRQAMYGTEGNSRLVRVNLLIVWY